MSMSVKMLWDLIKPSKKVINSQQQPNNITLKPMIITDFSAINYFRGGNNKTPFNSNDFVENFRQTFKKLDTSYRLKVLFYYIKDRTEGGIYKKEDNRIIGQYFGVGKDMIGGLIKQLKETNCIEELTEIDLFKLKKDSTYYKLLKEDYNEN